MNNFNDLNSSLLRKKIKPIIQLGSINSLERIFQNEDSDQISQSQETEINNQKGTKENAKKVTRKLKTHYRQIEYDSLRNKFPQYGQVQVQLSYPLPKVYQKIINFMIMLDKKLSQQQQIIFDTTTDLYEIITLTQIISLDPEIYIIDRINEFQICVSIKVLVAEQRQNYDNQARIKRFLQNLSEEVMKRYSEYLNKYDLNRFHEQIGASMKMYHSEFSLEIQDDLPLTTNIFIMNENQKSLLKRTLQEIIKTFKERFVSFILLQQLQLHIKTRAIVYSEDYVLFLLQILPQVFTITQYCLGHKLVEFNNKLSFEQMMILINNFLL